MKAEEIAEKLWKKHGGGYLMYEYKFHNFIREAIELHEQSRWKYPAKGELPEEGARVLYASNNDKSLRVCRYHEGHFIENGYSLIMPKKWQYAPGVE